MSPLRVSTSELAHASARGKAARQADPAARAEADRAKATELRDRIILEELREIRAELAAKKQIRYDVVRDRDGLIESVVAVAVREERA